MHSRNVDEIMEIWLEKNEPDNNGEIEIFKNYIPLTTEEFIHWLKDHTDLTFVFNITHEYLLRLGAKNNFLRIAVYHYSSMSSSESDDDTIDNFKRVFVEYFDEGDSLNIEIKLKNTYGLKRKFQLNDELKSYFDHKLGEKYTRVEQRTKKIFKKAINDWDNVLKGYFKFNAKISLVESKRDFPEKITENGELNCRTIKIKYKKLPSTDIMEIIINKDLHEANLKNLLIKINNFGYYSVNTLSVILEEVNTTFKTTTVRIRMFYETINNDDYYRTIGYYRTTYEAICIKKQFNDKGLVELAKDLGIESCEQLGERVNNLKWSDFLFSRE